MNISNFSKKYNVRRLTEKDLSIIYEMNCKNELFYQYHPPFVTEESILDDMRALPPNKTYEDKYYLGFFEDDVLVANMDLILRFPTMETAYLGFFMMNVEYQNQGIGSKLIADACSYLKILGYKKVRLGVDKGNPQSFSFWKKNGFHVVDEKDYIRMELDL